MNDLDDRNFLMGGDEDTFDDDLDESGSDDLPGDAPARQGLFGMSPVEQMILALFVLLNVVAFLVIIFLVTGVFGGGTV